LNTCRSQTKITTALSPIYTLHSSLQCALRLLSLLCLHRLSPSNGSQRSRFLSFLFTSLLADDCLTTRLAFATQRLTTVAAPPPPTPPLGATVSQQVQTRTGLFACTLSLGWSHSASELLYDWRFTANQFDLAPSPLRNTTRIFSN
jgi:hypothetical protein